MLDVNYVKNKELGLWEATATLTLPPLTVVRLKKDKDDFRYELSRAFTDIVEQIVEKAVEDDD